MQKIWRRNYANDTDGGPQDGKKLLSMWRNKEQASNRQCHISRGFVFVYLTIKIKCTHTNKKNLTLHFDEIFMDGFDGQFEALSNLLQQVEARRRFTNLTIKHDQEADEEKKSRDAKSM